jgi:hypothetical protein
VGREVDQNANRARFFVYIYVIKLKRMTVKQLQDKLSTFDPEMTVLGEFDSDGDEFMVKVDVKKVYKGDGVDDTNWDEENDGKKYCIIQLKY